MPNPTTIEQIRSRLLRVWRGNQFLSHTAALLTGNVSAQVIALLSAPILTRIYSPVEFAGLALVTAIVTILSIAATGRYELAVVLEDDEKAAARVAVLVLYLSGAAAALSAVAVLATSELLFSYWALEGSPALFWFVPVLVLILALNSLALRWRIREKQFRSIAIAELAGVAVTVVTQIVAGKVANQPTIVGLVLGLLLGRTAACAISGSALWPLVVRNFGAYGFRSLLQTARRHWRFPAFTTCADLTASGTVEAPKLILGALFPSHVLGSFAFTVRILEKPVSLATASVSQVFYRRIVEIRNQPELARRNVYQLSAVLVSLILLPAFVLAIWAEPIFGFMFGPEWREAGSYARLLTPMLVVKFAVVPSWTSLLALERQHFVFYWHLAHFVGTTVALLAASSLGSVELVISAYAVTGIIMYIVLFKMILHCISNSEYTKGQQYRRGSQPA